MAAFCCRKGDVVLVSNDMPLLLNDLYTGIDDVSRDFHICVRTYNNTFAFTSLGCGSAAERRKGDATGGGWSDGCKEKKRRKEFGSTLAARRGADGGDLSDGEEKSEWRWLVQRRREERMAWRVQRRREERWAVRQCVL
nr:uncharacterized protein LOC109153274 [Ipomoea batatas]